MALAGLLPSTVEYATIETVNEYGQPDHYVSLECQFNPEELTVTKEVAWATYEEGKRGKGVAPTPGRNAPDLDFAGGKPAEFTLDLTFDTTRETTSAARDVRRYTNALLRLTMLRKQRGGDPKAPPVVRFKWGRFELFLAIVTSVAITYKLFHANGLPARATAKVSFQQLDDTDDVEAWQNPTSRTDARQTRIVQQGERLDLIAHEEYGHPSHWRFLAEANHLLDPRDLEPGQILVIPRLP